MMIVKSDNSGTLELDPAKLFEGTCMTTVPSCPDVGRATVDVRVDEPLYKEVIVVKSDAPLVDGACTITVPSRSDAGRAAVDVIVEVPL